MPKSDFKTICNATVEGSLSLIGCTLFFGNLFDTVANRITSFNPVALGVSLPGLVSSIPFSVVAAYGSYKCHDETGLSNQPQEKIRLLNNIVIETEKAEDDVLNAILAENSEDTVIYSKTKEELINIIKDLKVLVREQKAKLADEEAEKETARSIPLKFMQKLGLTGERIAHSAGFTGDILAFMRLCGGIPFEAELVLQVCCLAIGYVSAMSEIRTAEESMRLNNLRKNLLVQHSLFKQQVADADTVDALAYQKLEEGTRYPHLLSPASSLSPARP